MEGTLRSNVVTRDERKSAMGCFGGRTRQRGEVARSKDCVKRVSAGAAQWIRDEVIGSDSRQWSIAASLKDRSSHCRERTGPLQLNRPQDQLAELRAWPSRQPRAVIGVAPLQNTGRSASPTTRPRPHSTSLSLFSTAATATASLLLRWSSLY